MSLHISERAKAHLLQLLSSSDLKSPLISLDRVLEVYTPDSPVVKAALEGADAQTLGALIGPTPTGGGYLNAGLHSERNVPSEQVREVEGIRFYVHPGVWEALSNCTLDMEGERLCLRDRAGKLAIF